MIDVVIPLADSGYGYNGSRFYNLELKFCLRSIEKNLKNYRDIYIVGDLPDWCTGVKYLPAGDESKLRNKNILSKLLVACDENDLSEKWMLCNDDYIFLNDFDATAIPYYCDGDLLEIIHSDYNSGYKRAVQNTIDILLPHTTIYNYDIHYPMEFRKELFINLFTGMEKEVVIKSSYCNYFPTCTQQMNDPLIKTSMTYKDIQKNIEGKNFISVNNRSFNEPMRKLLNDIFPNKSKFEK